MDIVALTHLSIVLLAAFGHKKILEDAMDFTMPEELEQIRRTVKSFVNEYLRPLEDEVDAADYLDPSVMARLRQKSIELGLFGHNLPESIGGGGVSKLAGVVIAEEIGRTSIPLQRAGGFLSELLVFAKGDQVDWYQQPIITGKTSMCYALTEADAGSDLGGVRTRARRVDNGWVLNGSKQFISNVATAEFILVLAVTDPDASLKSRFSIFIVHRDNPGYTHDRSIKKMGWHGADLSAFTVSDCRVEDGAVLGEIGGGFNMMMASINSTRVQLAATYNGLGMELLERGIAYAKERRTFGKRLADHQSLQFKLADIECELTASKLMTYQAAKAVDNNQPDARIAASRAKLYASEMVGRAADSVVQIFGAAGVTRGFPIERMYRDARPFRIGEGSSEMQRIQIARHILA
jgi:acyl-CoA dehydrogenase